MHIIHNAGKGDKYNGFIILIYKGKPKRRCKEIEKLA
jgi:hypothetical protein